MTKSKEKYLLVVSFLEGHNFPARSNTKFVIETKFDGEQLSTDPVDHTDTIEINQELAWELDKKSLQLHKLQRSCIKANCFAVTDRSKELIGYVVLDVRSAPDGFSKPKTYPLLQPKYPKAKPTLQINIYVEEDQSGEEATTNISNSPKKSLLNTQMLTSDIVHNKSTKKLKVFLNEDEGFFQIGDLVPNAHTYLLTITIAFARNLVKLILNMDEQKSGNFFFVYTFLNNQVTTKPFSDIVSCQINSERSSVRLHSTLDNLKEFFNQQNKLEIMFCSDTKIIAKTILNWKLLLDKLVKSNLSNPDSSIVIDQHLKFESVDEANKQDLDLSGDMNISPLIGIQVCLFMEAIDQTQNAIVHTLNSDENIQKASSGANKHYENDFEEEENDQHTTTNLANKLSKSHPDDHVEKIIYQNDTTTITVDENQKESVLNVMGGAGSSKAYEIQNYITEEMQLKAAYELQLWREAKEKEFENHLKKLEAKKFQALADAFKQHDIEREILIQKKIKEYNDLETLLRNSLNEVEKREKQLSFNETQVARLKADLHHDYENKLVELREASRRVQEKADHQLNLLKSKIEHLEEDISKFKRQVIEWEKKYADKEAEFARYKERENNRPEIKLQSEINLLNLDKIELERKLDAMTKAKNYYKDQFTKSLQELAAIKKREEANARSLLKKQQMELDHLRLKFMANEETELLKSDEKQLQSLKNELEKMRINNQNNVLSQNNDQSKTTGPYSVLNSENIDPSLKQHVNRLIEEKESLLRTGVYSNSDLIIVELDKRIKDCLKLNNQN